MQPVFALWWDDAKRSTHMHPEPFNRASELEEFAREKGLKIYTCHPVNPNDVRFFFPKHVAG